MQGVARFQAGAVEVLCLTDGGTVFGPEVFPDLPAVTRAAFLADAGLTDVQTEFNAYVLRFSDGRITLVDTGCGAIFGPRGGRLAGLLKALEIAPADVSRIIFTHLHGDHCGGALDDGRLVFPDAEIVIHKAESAHWQGKDAPGGRLLGLVQARLVEDGADLGDGIRVWALPGHTPGHMGLRLDGLVLVGDVIHSEALQLPDPHNATKYDVDPAAALQSRTQALAEVADQGLIWSGSHMLGPQKFARLTRDGAGFRRVAL